MTSSRTSGAPAAAGQPVTSGPQALTYAPAAPPRVARRRRARRVVALVLLAFAAAAALNVARRWGPAWWRHWEYLGWQRQCMEYAQAPGTVVYDTDWDRGTQLLASGRGHRAVPVQGRRPMRGPPLDVYLPEPDALHRLGLAQTQWPDAPDGTGVAFMHRRRSPAGLERLVLVRFTARNTVGPVTSSVSIGAAQTLVPASWRQPGSRLTWDAPGGGFWNVSSSYGFRLFAGMPDANDESHFTIRFEAWNSSINEGYAGLIDGWLRDDGTVEMKLREGAGDRISDLFGPKPGGGNWFGPESPGGGGGNK